MLTVLADTFRIATFQRRNDRPTAPKPDAKDEIRRLRAEFPQLNDHLLRDIGLDPNQIDEEERPPIWRWSSR